MHIIYICAVYYHAMCLLQMEANNAVSVSYRYGIKVNLSEQVNVHSYYVCV
jgi:hypothetical protein